MKRRISPTPFALAAVLAAGLPWSAPSEARAQSARPAASVSSHWAPRTLPAIFELNRGQFGPQVRFVTRSAGYTVSFRGSGADFTLHAPSGPATQLGLHLAGANPHPSITGRQKLPGIVNYYLGNDPHHWYTGVPTYAQIVYHAVYPHTDLVFYHSGARLEYDWVLRPGADARRIAFTVTGTAAPRLDRAGTLRLDSHGAALTQRAPHIYQWSAGSRQTVGGRFVLRGHDRVGIALGAYDRSRALIVDPIVEYSTYENVATLPGGAAITTDTANGVYITGDTSSTYVSKLDATTGAILWTTLVGGTGNNHAYAITADNAGSVFEGGSTSATDFPKANNSCLLFYGGCSEAFVAKLNSATGILASSTYLGGTNNDRVNGIAQDGAGTVYVTGSTNSYDFRGATNPCTNFCHKGFVAKLSGSDLSLAYAKIVGGDAITSGGGTPTTTAAGIALDANGTLYITGNTNASDFPAASNPCSAPCGGPFAAALSATNGSLLWSTYLGGTDGSGIAVHSGSVYIAGYTQRSSIPATNSCTNPGPNNSCSDAFLTGLNATTGAITFFTFVGGTGLTLGYGVVADDAGVFMAGHVEGPILPAQTNSCAAGTVAGTCGNADAFVSRIDGTSGRVLASTFAGGSFDDEARGIALDQNGQLYIVGNTSSSNLPKPTNVCRNCNGDAFVMRLSPASVVAGNTGTTNDPTQSALATTGGTGPGTPGSLTATASGGTGTVDVAIYDINPVNRPSFANAGGYVDVRVSPGNSFTQVQIQDCTPANGHQLFWFNGTAWGPVGTQVYDPASGCVSATIDSTSSPSIAQLTGTVFATGTSSAPTAALVLHFSARHAHGGFAFHWTVVANRGITGFNLFVANRRLNARIIPVHGSRAYRYGYQRSGAGPFTLHVLLRNGGTLIVPAG